MIHRFRIGAVTIYPLPRKNKSEAGIFAGRTCKYAPRGYSNTIGEQVTEDGENPSRMRRCIGKKPCPVTVPREWEGRAEQRPESEDDLFGNFNFHALSGRGAGRTAPGSAPFPKPWKNCEKKESHA